ncbi:GNAT family N-acetyltransferase [bacterium]|nr:GNAT family N-acetyltransferase [bacterium]
MLINELTKLDREWVSERTELLFGGEFVVSREVVHNPAELPGFVVSEGHDRIGITTYNIVEDECELVTIDSLCQWQGVGSILLEAVEKVAKDAGCKTLWTITSNDNLDALRFLQRRGFVIKEVRVGIAEQIRMMKPGMQEIGHYNIPVRDEIELIKSL